VVAALLGAGDAKALTERVQQRRPGVDGEPVIQAIDPKQDVDVHADLLCRIRRAVSHSGYK
jgi:hypothetical protein